MGATSRRAQAVAPLLCAVSLVQLFNTGHCQGNTSLVLDAALTPTLPVLVAPSELTGSLKINGSYSLYQAGTSTLAGSRSRTYSVAPNSTLVLKSFVRISCASFAVAGANQVYAFLTRAGITPNYAPGGKQGYLLRRDPFSYTGEVYPSILIPTNSTITDRLSYGPIANSTSGVVSITVNLTESVSIVLVNPSNSTEDVVLDMSMSPLGPCQQCNKERDQNGLLGTCGSSTFDNATIVLDGSPEDASSYEILLQPGQSELQDLDQGASAVFSVFTNASCMLYTIKQGFTPSDFNLNKALLTAWVSTSAQQQQIVGTGTATDQQRDSMACAYPAYADVRRPCYVYSDKLDPRETYYVWVRNQNGGTASYGGNITVDYELMILTDPADCSQERFFNLSHSFLYLNTPAAPLPYTQVNNASVRSPYDPGVTPFSFLAGLGNVNFNYPITEVRADGSVSQVGYWNISFIDGDSTKLVTPITDTDLITFPLAVDQVRVQYPGAGTFTNAACFAEVLNASNPVTSFLLPRSTYQANYNYSTALAPSTGLTTGAYDNSFLASRQFRVQSVNSTITGLSPDETYSFVVSGAIRNGTMVSTRTAMFPPGSPRCNQTSGQTAPASAPAPSPAAALTLTSGAVRAVFDRPIIQSGEGGADVAGTIFGASCVAFALSARGPFLNNTGPPLFSQYYNISRPSNASQPNLSASALLLEGVALNKQFVEMGFPNSTESTAPLDIVTGCRINSTHPGPCFAYADGLDTAQIYYLWAVIGAKTPSSWVLISYEALPSGSCKDLFPAVRAASTLGSAAAPTAPVPASSSSVSIGLIVGPVVAGVVVIAAAVLALFLVRRKRAKKQPQKVIMEDAFAVTRASPWEETDAEYAFFKDVIGPDGETITVESIIPSAFQHKPSTTDFKSESKTATGTTDTTGTPYDSDSIAAAAVTSATQHVVQSASEQSQSTVVQSGTRQPLPTNLSATSQGGRPLSAFGSGMMVADFRDEWEINLAELKLKVVDGKAAKLGEGGFGSVFLGFLGVREVAVKIATGNSAAQKEKFLHEILILKGCRDPNIVQFLGASVGDKQIVCVMEFMPGGDLYKAIGQDTGGQFLWRNRGAKLALDIVKGLYHLHSKNIVHMDLKTPNILLNATKDQAKISDVGLAKFTSDAGTIATGGASFMWASPEQLLSGKCTAASDMFSFGVVLWEICTGEPPARTRQYRPLAVPDECPQPVADLVVQCLDPEPARRPTAQQAHQVLTKCARLRPGQPSQEQAKQGPPST